MISIALAVIALAAAAWLIAYMRRIDRKLDRLDQLAQNIYYIIYQLYMEPQPERAAEQTEDDEKVENEDDDKVKEACVMELIRARGCVDVQEVLDKCSVSKSFIMNKLYRKSKAVSFIEGGRKICPRRM